MTKLSVVGEKDGADIDLVPAKATFRPGFSAAFLQGLPKEKAHPAIAGRASFFVAPDRT
jgi:hypothetical protein